MRFPKIHDDYIAPEAFPFGVERQAQRLGWKPENFKGRKNVGGLVIDNSEERVINEAILVQRNRIGYLVTVTIPDLDALVPIDSFVDLEALKRVEIVKYPNIVSAPILPGCLSQEILSFRNKDACPGISISAFINNDLETISSKIEMTVLRERILIDAETFSKRIAANKSDYFELAVGLAGKRISEDRIKISKEDNLVRTERLNGEVDDKTLAGFVLEEFSVWANYQIAQFLVWQNSPALYRNVITYNNGPQQKVRSNFDAVSHGHAELNLPDFVFFTSPSRRYADMVSHRQVKAILESRSAPYSFQDIQSLACYLNNRKKGMAAHAHTKNFNLKIQEVRQWSAEELAHAPTNGALGFYNLFEIALKNPADHPKFIEAFKLRFALRQVRPLEITNLFFEAELKGEDWNEIRELALQNLYNNPGHFSFFIEALRGKYKTWNTLNVQLTSMSDGIQAQAFIQKNGIWLTTAFPCFSEENDRDARRMALVGLFSHYLTDELVEWNGSIQENNYEDSLLSADKEGDFVQE